MSRIKDHYFDLYEDQSYDQDGVCMEELAELESAQSGYRAFASMVEHLTQTPELAFD
jgi:hypothetical protein